MTWTSDEGMRWLEREGSTMTLTAQAALLGISRASIYYQPRQPSPEEVAIKHQIDAISTEHR